MKRVKVLCPNCVRETNHNVLHDEVLSGCVHDIHWNEEYQIVSCCGCDTVSFRRVQSNSEDYSYDEQGSWVTDEYVDLYPPRREGAELSFHHAIPNTVYAAYRETSQALAGDQPILAGIGMRLVVEMICHEAGARGGNLQDKIRSLVNLGVITQAGADLLDKARLFGNSAAHEAKKLDRPVLDALMEVVELMVRQQYVVPALADSTLALPEP